MIWQDFVIGATNILLSYALVPQIYDGMKKQKALVHIQTSLISAVSLFILSFTVFTLDLYFATITTFLGGLLWFILLLQKLIYK